MRQTVLHVEVTTALKRVKLYQPSLKWSMDIKNDVKAIQMVQHMVHWFIDLIHILYLHSNVMKRLHREFCAKSLSSVERVTSPLVRTLTYSQS